MSDRSPKLFQFINRAASIVSYNSIAAGFNLISTVLMVRWYGASIYAEYTVDLALMGLLLIFLEIVPSSYSVFRVQDKPDLVNGLAALSVVSGMLLAGIVFVYGNVLNLFHGYSVWMILYILLISLKRYIDIRLQSSGQLNDYFKIELVVSVARTLLMALFFWIGIVARDAVWASFALATLFAQWLWFIRNSHELKPFGHLMSKSAWQMLGSDRKMYPAYYIGIFLKRVRDSSIPLLANFYFPSKEIAGIFFLLYRGLVFVSGQIRVIEGLLNHRKTLDSVAAFSFPKLVIVASFAQLLCILASVILAYASGVVAFPIVTILILSSIVWFNVFSVLQRAKAYSSFIVGSVNASLLTYTLVATGSVWLAHDLGVKTSNGFSGILLISEILALCAMTCFRRR